MVEPKVGMNKGRMVNMVWDNIETGDMVICGGLDFTDYIIRMVTRGFKYRHDPKISTHTGIIIKLAGYPFVAEMKPEGLDINSLNNYNKGKNNDYIINIVRSHLCTDKHRESLEKSVMTDFLVGRHYSFKGNIHFVFNGIEPDKKRNFCSQYVALKLTSQLGISWGEPFHDISPYELQERTEPNRFQSIAWHD